MAVTEILQLGIKIGTPSTGLGPPPNEQFVARISPVKYDFIARTLYWYSRSSSAAGKAYILEDGYAAADLVGETPAFSGLGVGWHEVSLSSPIHIVRGKTYYAGFKTSGNEYSVGSQNSNQGFIVWWRTTNDPGGYPSWVDATYSQNNVFGWYGVYLTNEDRPLNKAMPSGLNM